MTTGRLVFFLATAPLLILLTHRILIRVAPRCAPQKGAALAALFAFLPAGLLFWHGFLRGRFLPPEYLWSATAYFAIVFGCSGYVYFHIFNMSETARRIRILHEIYKAGSLSPKEVLGLYDAGGIVDVRLGRLVDTGQLELRGDRYCLRGKILYRAAQAIQGWRVLLGFEKEKRG